MNKLLALADRVEKLTGPDREVDGLIADATGWWLSERDRLGPSAPMVMEAARFTGSLDDAMTLVPEGHTVQLSDWDNEALRRKGAWQAIVLPFGARGAMKDFTFTNRSDHVATPSMALTCAALRARAHGGGEG